MAKVTTGNIQIFPITNISSPFRYTLLTEENTVNNVTAMYDIKTIDGKSNDGFVIAYSPSTGVISFILGGYYVKINDILSYVDTSSTAVYASMTMDYTSLVEGDKKSKVSIDPTSTTGELLNFDISNTYPQSTASSPVVCIKLLEKVGQGWVIPKEALVRNDFKKSAGIIDCGRFSSISDFNNRATIFADRDVDFN